MILWPNDGSLRQLRSPARGGRVQARDSGERSEGSLDAPSTPVCSPVGAARYAADSGASCRHTSRSPEYFGIESTFRVFDLRSCRS